jgi:ribosomal protein S18 acetylase RimI-like enzyme
MTLSRHGGQAYEIQISEISEHDPSLISTLLDIDLMTFSEPTWSRYTAGLMLRHGRTYVMFADDVPIGTCQCIRSWESPWEVVLFSMAIRPGWRGQGLGTHFLDVVLKALENSGARSVVLEVDPKSTAAISLYEEKFGFTVVAECIGEYGPGHDRVHMRRPLTASPVAEVAEFPMSDDETDEETLATDVTALGSTTAGTGREPFSDPPSLEANPGADPGAEPGASTA